MAYAKIDQNLGENSIRDGGMTQTDTIESLNPIISQINRYPEGSSEKTRLYIVYKATVSGINPELALFISEKEAYFQEKAKNPKSTAKGPFQILDGTWKAFGCQGVVLDSFDNTDCAIKILSSPNGISHWLADPQMKTWLQNAGFAPKI